MVMLLDLVMMKLMSVHLTNLDTKHFSLSVYGTFPHDDEKFTEGIIGVKKHFKD